MTESPSFRLTEEVKNPWRKNPYGLIFISLAVEDNEKNNKGFEENECQERSSRLLFITSSTWEKRKIDPRSHSIM